MKRLAGLLIFGLFIMPILAQDDVFNDALSPVEIDTVTITRRSENDISLHIEWLASDCGELFIYSDSSEVYLEFTAPPEGDPQPAGDMSRNNRHRYINLSLFTVPDNTGDCDSDEIRSTDVDISSHINFDPEFEPDTILLINDFAAWLQLVEPDVEGMSPQYIDTGETELVRWQKVDSAIETLYSLGADPQSFIPWIQGYHPDGCQSPTMMNITAHPVENDHYTVEVFRLLPLDTICPASIQEFIVSAGGVVPQRDIILTIGDSLSYQVFAFDGEVIPATRRYIPVDTVEISAVDSAYEISIEGTQTESCDSEVITQQVEIEGISFISIYYDVPDTAICTDDLSPYQQTLTVNSVPVVINGMLYEQATQ